MTSVNRNKQVVAYSVNPQAPRHEVETNRALAQWLAQILGWEYGDSHDPDGGHDPYLLPTQTLIGPEALMRLAVKGPEDVWGGYVEHDFICTKAITHGLLNKDAVAPKGWSPLFAKLTRGAVLDGVTVFSLKDARPAAEHLLYTGPIRLKPIHACAGRGQRLIKSLAQFDEIAAAPDAQALFREGVVLEQHLNEVKTQSVGQSFINGKVLSYCGVQHLTHDSEGLEVYGGSDLLVVQGGYIELLRLELPDDVREAVRLAQVFDDAANQAYPSFFASRRNYDIARAWMLPASLVAVCWSSRGAWAAPAAPNWRRCRCSSKRLKPARCECPRWKPTSTKRCRPAPGRSIAARRTTATSFSNM